jgi:hypothetical protein
MLELEARKDAGGHPVTNGKGKSANIADLSEREG